MVLAPCIERGQSRRVWEYLRFYLRTSTLLGLGLIAVTWSVAVLHLGSTDPEDHHPLAWAALAVPVNAAGALIGRTLQSARRPAQAIIPWRLGLPLVQIVLLAAVVVWRGSLTAHEGIVLSIVAAAAISLWQWRSILRLKLVEPIAEPAFRQPRVWLATSVPMMGAFLVALALNQSDLYFLELLADEATVGHYAAAATAAHVLTLIQVTIVGLVAPLAKPAIEAGVDASRTTYRHGLGWLLALLVPAGLLLAAFGEPILGLFGTAYRVGHGVLLLLAIGYFTWAVAALSALWLQYTSRASVVLTISIATLVIDSALNVLLIPRYGMTGAAASTALTLTAGALAVIAAHRWKPVPRAPEPPSESTHGPSHSGR